MDRSSLTLVTYNLNKFDWISSNRGKGRSEQTLAVKGREIPEDISTALDTLNINSDTVSDEHQQKQE